VAVQLEGARSIKPAATATLLTSEKVADENSFETPRKISPQPVSIEITSPTFTQAVPPHAFMVLRIGVL
jgi:alpha-L-arabinofuranosidase